MKKTLVLLSTISMSVFLSACGNPGPNDMHKPDMEHSEQWRADHEEHMRMMTEHYFDAMDANHDGEVSKKEFMDFQRKMFREIDMDHNGYLTLDEVQAYKKKEMEKWKHEHHHEGHDGDMKPDMHYQDRSMRDDSATEMNQADRY